MLQLDREKIGNRGFGERLLFTKSYENPFYGYNNGTGAGECFVTILLPNLFIKNIFTKYKQDVFLRGVGIRLFFTKGHGFFRFSIHC
ncbi:MAG: hypothetical protein LBH50_05500, partial [Spirochaetaceae bacterium]|nr:hypothetical protein [Spirochaetaceae bacterium]